ncbi:antibiotic biosynthesis monooxygenase [Rhizodiscina lignyota]|uniref:Antibiotic biosynthesis monooxygenase n=1 Tax=Rhizodiscina lignyota TaxID=1504668 RepID=A0A9P4I5N5_9PEZI|nr:antibiotic biosynthesis monooxygenase [Rhizodiscina lignyota]
MFVVIFEVLPHNLDTYFSHAASLRPILQQIPGFVDNIRYRSLTRQGALLSVSTCATEKALVRWRTTEKHWLVQEKGRQSILQDYHLRVGQVVSDSTSADGPNKEDERTDATEVGQGNAAVLIEAELGEEWVKQHKDDSKAVATQMGCGEKYLGKSEEAMVAWDLLEAALTPGSLIMLASFRDVHAAEEFLNKAKLPAGARSRVVRVVRDYGMFDRREAPQYHGPVPESNNVQHKQTLYT